MKNKVLNRSVRLLVTLSMLVAISIVCGKYLAIKGGDILRFSFENLPIIFAGVAFGPISGLAVGVVADLVGCVLVGYAINPIVTVGAAAIGAVSGGVYWVLRRLVKLGDRISVIASVTLSHGIGSVIIKTFGLAKFYSMPMPTLMLWRLVNYLIVGAVECVFLLILFKNKQIIRMINDMTGKKNEGFKNYANSFQAVTVPGLERIGALCHELGDPQDSLRFIHVAGTNGKGSVCANLACILEEAGYKVGKYISPNLIRVNERISVNGVEISDADMTRILGIIEPLCATVEKKTGLAPTQFEIWTALAFTYFAEVGCDYVVLEVGLGGEYDATNVIKKNEIAIITRLGLDHMQYLGNTIEEVAKAKAGIIKSESTTHAVVTVAQDGGALPVIEKKAEESGCRVICAKYELSSQDGIFESFNAYGISDIVCGIAGMHQAENSALAVAAALELGVGEEFIRRGVRRAKNPARFEMISEDPTVIYDGGHNENGITALMKSIERYYPEKPKTVVFACMKDKEIELSLKLLGHGDTKFIFTTVKNNPRAMSAEELCHKSEEYGVFGEYFEEIGEAYERAIELNRLTVICGSLYLYKDFSEYLNKKKGEE